MATSPQAKAPSVAEALAVGASEGLAEALSEAEVLEEAGKH